ncbi:MAG TPA: hypothetical protein VEK34_05930 [Methylocella sp.]|nr:hypothetical protein [Methylocella sp.]
MIEKGHRLDDVPVAVIDNVQTAPALYYVHTDHLFRSSPEPLTQNSWRSCLGYAGKSARSNRNK